MAHESSDGKKKLLHVKINGIACEVEEGTTILQLALRMGIYIPHWCYHPGLPIVATCRLCVVECLDADKPQAACSTRVWEGIEILTESEKAKKARMGLLELFLLNHPLDCPICDQSGECILQDYSFLYGSEACRTRYHRHTFPKHPNHEVGDVLDMEMNRCVHCTRCVRFTQYVTKTHEFNAFNRGEHMDIGMYFGGTMGHAYQGNMADICPVGCLTTKDFRFKSRVWDLDSVPTVCNHCAAGCNIHLETRQGEPMRIISRINLEVNNWWICDHGRASYKMITNPDRVPIPLKRDTPEPSPVAWDEAIPAFAHRLRTTPPEKIGVIIAPTLTTEELWLARRLFVKQLGIKSFALWPPKSERQDPAKKIDDLLLRADPFANSRAAKLLNLDLFPVQDLLDKAAEYDLLVLWGANLKPEDWAKARHADYLVEVMHTRVLGENQPDLLLPATTWAEKDGTLINGDGHLQRMNAALDPLEDSQTDLAILSALGHELKPNEAVSDYAMAFDMMAAEESWLTGIAYDDLGFMGIRLNLPDAAPIPPTPGIVPVDNPDFAMPYWRQKA